MLVQNIENHMEEIKETLNMEYRLWSEAITDILENKKYLLWAGWDRMDFLADWLSSFVESPSDYDYFESVMNSEHREEKLEEIESENKFKLIETAQGNLLMINF